MVSHEGVQSEAMDVKARQQVPPAASDLCCTMTPECRADAVVILIDPNLSFWDGEAACEAHRPPVPQ